jgi:ribonuclease P/MRP protein subunit POP7
MATNTATPAAGSPPTTTTRTTTTTTSKNLPFKKQNTNLVHIPRNYRIQKRPIPHAPIASPYAGNKVAKLVYVSSKTPFMSAVKRVQKLLRMAERRAMMPVIDGRQQRRNHHHHHHNKGYRKEEAHVLEKCQQRLREDKVLVKATGRAIEKALEVGRWFEMGKGKAEDEYEVEVRTGSVCVVDDIVEGDDKVGDDEDDDEKKDEDGNERGKAEKDTAEGNEKTESKNQSRRRRKRERIRQQRLDAFQDEDGEPPESRTRWINMVEIAINIK